MRTAAAWPRVRFRSPLNPAGAEPDRQAKHLAWNRRPRQEAQGQGTARDSQPGDELPPTHLVDIERHRNAVSDGRGRDAGGAGAPVDSDAVTGADDAGRAGQRVSKRVETIGVHEKARLPEEVGIAFR